MAIGDSVANLALVNANISLQLSFNCPFDGTLNTTPQITKTLPAIFGQAFTMYGSMACITCGKRIFLTVTDNGVSAQGQQVQP